MISIQDKIEIINSRIKGLSSLYDGILIDISRIESGMEDPDMSIQECNQLLVETSVKIEKLNIEKEALTSQV